MAGREKITKGNIATGFMQLHKCMNRRLREKGRLSFASTHECLGVVIEEIRELEDAVRDNDKEQTVKELYDVALAALFSAISIQTGKVDR